MVFPGGSSLFLAATSSPGLRAVAWVSLGIAVGSAVVIVIDIVAGRRQQMGVMNVVWPITALYAGPLALVAYCGLGRAKPHSAAMNQGHMEHAKRPMWQSALLGSTHCGAGCAIGDVITEGGLFWVGASALLGSTLLTSYVLDFVAAYLLGIVFQYFAIAPMRHLPVGQGIWAAIKAETFSLIAFQIGMYVWMAIYQKLIFHPRVEPNSPVYWFMMQIGMIAGLATTYPMNWLLIRKGMKEAM